MKSGHIFLALFVIIFSGIVLAQEVPVDNSTENATLNDTIIPDPIIVPNETTNDTTTQPDPIIEPEPVQHLEKPKIINFTVAEIIPKVFNVGDVQFNIRVKNTGTVKLEELDAALSGKGFLTSEVIAIESLEPGETSYMIIQGTFRERGDITLTIKIDGRTFKQVATVIDPNYQDDQEKAEELQAAESAKKKLLLNLSNQVDDIDTKYSELDAELQKKKTEKYDVITISLSDLKKYLREARSAITVSDADRAKASIVLAEDEYDDLKKAIDNAQKIKQSFFETIRSNLLLISSLAGAFVTVFAFIELVKKKKESISQKVMEVKVSFDKKKSKKIKQAKPKKKPAKRTEKAAEAKQEQTQQAENNKNAPILLLLVLSAV